MFFKQRESIKSPLRVLAQSRLSVSSAAFNHRIRVPSKFRRQLIYVRRKQVEYPGVELVLELKVLVVAVHNSVEMVRNDIPREVST